MRVGEDSGGIKGGMGAFPPVGGSSPTFPQSEEKYGQNQPFFANFWTFAPSETHFFPRCPPQKKKKKKKKKKNFWHHHWVKVLRSLENNDLD